MQHFVQKQTHSMATEVQIETVLQMFSACRPAASYGGLVAGGGVQNS